MAQTADVAALVAAAKDGERRALARILSHVETGGDLGADVLRSLGPVPEDGYIVGITGAPGSGKSTLVGAMLKALRARDQRVAVLAVDPSSPFSRGALLGDRLRMTSGARDGGVYIRSMASRGQQGGLAAATQAASLVLQVCGWRWVLIETVGVGQVEVDIAGTADTTVLVVNPGWGDAVQANKAGLMEIGDVFVINKADRPGLADTRKDLHALLSNREEQPPPIVDVTATEGRGIEELLEAIDAHHEQLVASGDLRARQRTRLGQMLRLGLQAELVKRVGAVCETEAFQDELENLVAGTTAVPDSIERLLNRLLEQ